MLKTWEILRKCFKSSDGVRISRQLGREEARDGQLREPGRNRNLVYALKFLFARGLKWCWPLAVRLFEKKRVNCSTVRASHTSAKEYSTEGILHRSAGPRLHEALRLVRPGGEPAPLTGGARLQRPGGTVNGLCSGILGTRLPFCLRIVIWRKIKLCNVPAD
ncbi:uncharacterized protein LOC105298734 isoform X2 [Pteropus vampyrus]|uniref:Uncharacterized protein LOC105298734 isoform X2 n=1 Tax=Pteropus vampyrus TaxID=132908 RepID=A0A6P6CXX2_PTEVA|nr:uncharacterized protein LOC105298734 isoform X2 [Pteropus vampyrus]